MAQEVWRDIFVGEVPVMIVANSDFEYASI
jgi:hypothetical protein